MRRTIPALIAAVFADDPITPAEARRVLRHGRQQHRIDAWLLADSGISTDDPSLDGVSAPNEIADAFLTYRKEILRDLRKYTMSELRMLVRTLLVHLGTFVEFNAAHEGREQRQRKQHLHAAWLGVNARREAATLFLKKIAELEARHPPVATDVKAAQRYLRDTDPDWSASSDSERQRKVGIVTRRIRRARKITGRKRR